MVLASACLLGIDFKYNGANNLNPKMVELLSGKNNKGLPEVLASFEIPRPAVELKDGIAYRIDVKRVLEEILQAIEKIKALIKGKNVEYAMLKSHSPSCGAKQIYYGSFSHTLIDGEGTLA